MHLFWNTTYSTNIGKLAPYHFVVEWADGGSFCHQNWKGSFIMILFQLIEKDDLFSLSVFWLGRGSVYLFFVRYFQE